MAPSRKTEMQYALGVVSNHCQLGRKTFMEEPVHLLQGTDAVSAACQKMLAKLKYARGELSLTKRDRCVWSDMPATPTSKAKRVRRLSNCPTVCCLSARWPRNGAFEPADCCRMRRSAGASEPGVMPAVFLLAEVSRRLPATSWGVGVPLPMRNKDCLLTREVQACGLPCCRNPACVQLNQIRLLRHSLILPLTRITPGPSLFGGSAVKFHSYFRLVIF